MKKTKNKFIYMWIIVAVVIVVFGIIILVNVKYREGAKEKDFSDFSEHLQDYTDLAISFNESSLQGVCDYTDKEKVFKISGRNGSFFVDFDKGEFDENGGVLGGGGKITEEDFWPKIEASKDEILSYVDILKKYKYFSCIQEDLNLKLNKERAVAFMVGPYAKEKKGFIYLSDDSITENFNKEYFDKTYTKLTRTNVPGWYEFRLK